MKRTVAFSKNAVNVFFHILTGCNLRCRHCYINPDQHGRNRLPLAVIDAWLAAFSEKAGKANVIFLGGEPTLHPDLPAAIRRARSLGYQSVTVDTNGYLFNDILDKVTPEEVDFFSFSLDGATRETNDGIRGEGVYDACIAGVRNARQRGFQVSLIYTVSAANIHELEGMGPLLERLSIDRFFIQVIGIRGKSAGLNQTLQVPRKTWLGVVPPAAAEIARSGITVNYPKVFLAPDEPFACAGICAENYFIFPNGRVYRCPLCEDFPYHSLAFEGNRLVPMPRLNESDFFKLTIPEGCVMNRLIQPDNLEYGEDGRPAYQIACCMLKEEVCKG
jgi:MoaA/NifB/PqqE/SkfB family radical SAM enzyme